MKNSIVGTLMILHFNLCAFAEIPRYQFAYVPNYSYVDPYFISQLAVGLQNSNLPTASELVLLKKIGDVNRNGSTNSSDASELSRNASLQTWDIDGDGLVTWGDARFLEDVIANAEAASSIKELVSKICSIAENQRASCITNATKSIFESIKPKATSLNLDSLLKVLRGNGDGDRNGRINFTDDVICAKTAAGLLATSGDYNSNYSKVVCDMDLNKTTSSSDLPWLLRKRRIVLNPIDLNMDGLVSWRDLLVQAMISAKQTYKEKTALGGFLVFSPQENVISVKYNEYNGDRLVYSLATLTYLLDKNKLDLLRSIVTSNGDIDGDGYLTYRDVVKGTEISKNPTYDSPTVAYERISCDVDRNSTCDEADLEKIRGWLIGSGNLYLPF